MIVPPDSLNNTHWVGAIDTSLGIVFQFFLVSAKRLRTNAWGRTFSRAKQPFHPLLLSRGPWLTLDSTPSASGASTVRQFHFLRAELFSSSSCPCEQWRSGAAVHPTKSKYDVNLTFHTSSAVHFPLVDLRIRFRPEGFSFNLKQKLWAQKQLSKYSFWDPFCDFDLVWLWEWREFLLSSTARVGSGFITIALFGLMKEFGSPDGKPLEVKVQGAVAVILASPTKTLVALGV